MDSFDSLDLIPPVKKAIREEGYTTPSPVQAATIPAALAGRDVLGCAQTGTGKTAAFALPILDHFGRSAPKPVSKRPLALVLAPTRELAIQISESFATYGRHIALKEVVIYGGVGQGRQAKAIADGVHIVIATPGRLIDLLQQELIYLNRLQFFVVDEADRMMDMGFLPDLKRIMKALPVRKQSLFFSATMPKKIAQLAEQLLHRPVSVEISPEKTNVELIDQRVIFASFRQKKPLLAKLLTAGDVGQAIVFTRTRRGANAVAEYLRRAKIDAQPIHGNLSQNARQRVLDAFRADKVQVLVATDLASRGIDVDNISHVFNFELPAEAEAYVHRIGRTGRAGARGIAISLCSEEERAYLQDIEKLIGFEILPDGREPEPLPESASAAGGQTGRQGGGPRGGQQAAGSAAGNGDRPGSQNRRRRRKGTRRGRKPDAADGSSDRPQPEGEKRRPTAAERKAARNRRRRKKQDD